MSKTYDLIVVGAGPAGLTAAKMAAENGLSVALLERKDSPSDILRMCGMMLVTLTGNYMGERVTYNERSGLLNFPRHGFSLKYDGPTRIFSHGRFIRPAVNGLSSATTTPIYGGARPAGPARSTTRGVSWRGSPRSACASGCGCSPARTSSGRQRMVKGNGAHRRGQKLQGHVRHRR